MPKECVDVVDIVVIAAGLQPQIERVTVVGIRARYVDL